MDKWKDDAFLFSTEFDDGICVNCVHLHVNGMTCDAFPKGIPSEVRSGEHDHRKSYSGDHGIRFEPVKKEERK